MAEESVHGSTGGEQGGVGREWLWKGKQKVWKPAVGIPIFRNAAHPWKRAPEATQGRRVLVHVGTGGGGGREDTSRSLPPTEIACLIFLAAGWSHSCLERVSDQIL